MGNCTKYKVRHNFTITDDYKEDRKILLNSLFKQVYIDKSCKNEEILEICLEIKNLNHLIYRMRNEHDEKQLDCALGAVIGAFIGDSLGSSLEFKQNISSQALNLALEMKGGVFGNGPGQVTDDSELAMCLLNGISDSLPLWNGDSVAKYYRDWILSHPFDVGSTTRKAFRLLPDHQDSHGLADVARKCASESNQSSLSNGSFMRSSPLAVFCRHFEPDLINWIVTEDVSMTHPKKIIQEAETLYIICIAHLIQNPQDKAGAIQKVQNYANFKCEDEARLWLSDCFRPDKEMKGNFNIGYVKIAFDHSFRELRKEKVDFFESMKRILILGGDTDTNAAIVGAMVGAYVGYKAIPNQWKEKVEGYTYEREQGINRPYEFLDQTRVKGLVEKIFWGVMED